MIATSADLAREIREALHQGQQGLAEEYHLLRDPERYLAGHTALVDVALQGLWASLGECASQAALALLHTTLGRLPPKNSPTQVL